MEWDNEKKVDMNKNVDSGMDTRMDMNKEKIIGDYLVKIDLIA